MEHLAKDLTNALEESESCGPMNFDPNIKWGLRRRTRSAGNLHFFLNKSGDNRSDDSSSSYSEVLNRGDENGRNKVVSFHQSDSDDLSFKVMGSDSLRMRNPLQPFLRGRYNKLVVCHSLESDSFNEHSPARPSFRRKRKLKRMLIEETPIPQCGKRKRSQKLDILENGHIRNGNKIKPLHKSIVDKIEKFCKKPAIDDAMSMEVQSIDDNFDIASESSLSWSGGEGHEGDDELTDWAPSAETPSEPSYLSEYDPREIRAGCRRLGDERPGFSIVTNANERVAKFLQDSSKSELKLFGGEKDKIRQLANLYSLDLWSDGAMSTLLRKTNRTPCMQPTQRHHSSFSSGHKRIRVHAHAK
ncbi:uncharacterized protein LOC123310035 [Coccinella septempunctata]|uniref:uncharacterized protein LOC123310035 n=1 Tax=Coccinella septempunctata TaxID=41139 RepID=UPI001D0731C0|nr:uncharacterized protein LOC123310035 [Coccinella septempunctata]